MAVLSPAAPLDDPDLAWAADAADSLRRLVGHCGGPVAAAAEIERGIGEARRLPRGDRAARVVALHDLADRVRCALPEGTGRPAEIPLEVIADAARADGRRAARDRDAAVAIDVSTSDGIRVPRPVAGALVDALGRLMRDSVVFGTPAGGAIRVVAHAERDVLVVVASDRGGGVDVAPGGQLGGGRVAGLHAAAGCLASVGGELAEGVGPWGGASVTLRVPLAPPRPRRLGL